MVFVNARHLLISIVAQSMPYPGSHVHGLYVGTCERQEGSKGGKSHVVSEVGRVERS